MPTGTIVHVNVKVMPFVTFIEPCTVLYLFLRLVFLSEEHYRGPQSQAAAPLCGNTLSFLLIEKDDTGVGRTSGPGGTSQDQEVEMHL